MRLSAAIVILAARAAAGGTAAGNAYVARVPFAWTPGQIEISVRVNHAPATFLVDTGAEYSVVSSRLAAHLSLPTEKRGSRDFADDVTLTIGNVTLEHQRVMVMPFTTFYDRGRAIDGLIGHDLFARFVVGIDFTGKAVTVWQPTQFRAAKAAVVVPIEFAGRLPVIPSVFHLSDGRALKARLMVDTGASQAVILRYPFADQHGLLDLAGKPSTAPSVADGPRKLVDIPVEQVTISKWTFDRPAVLAYAEPLGSGAYTESDGLIGNTLLSRFTLYVDYPHQRLLFEPRRH
jgi:predicted aspartyl protease